MPLPKPETIVLVETAMPGWKVVEGPTRTFVPVDETKEPTEAVSFADMQELLGVEGAAQFAKDEIAAAEIAAEVKVCESVWIRPELDLNNSFHEKIVIVHNGEIIAKQG
jgi:hypothetical protein